MSTSPKTLMPRDDVRRAGHRSRSDSSSITFLRKRTAANLLNKDVLGVIVLSETQCNKNYVLNSIIRISSHQNNQELSIGMKVV